MSRKEPNRNVYVGHRYVPLILEEWDKKFEYEGLSVVTHKGASYTSKKRVPVGIDILNKEFWSLTGNYNAQIEYYREETERVSDKLDSKSDQTYVDTELGKKADQTYVDNELGDVDTELGKKANQTYVDTELVKKSDKTYVDTELNKKANQSYVNTELDKKANQSYVNTELDKKADQSYVDKHLISEVYDLQKHFNGDVLKAFEEVPGGSELYIPNGVFNFNEPIIRNEKIIVSGSGTLKFMGDTQYMLTLHGDGSEIKNGVTLDGNNLAGRGIGSSGDYITLDCEVINVTGYGIDIYGNYNHIGSNIKPNYNGYAGIRLFASARRIEYFSMDNVTIMHNDQKAFVVNGTRGIGTIKIGSFTSIVSSKESASNGFLIDTDQDNTNINVDNVIIDSMYMYGGESAGIKVENTDTFSVGTMVIRNRHSQYSQKYGGLLRARKVNIGHLDTDNRMAIFTQTNSLNIDFFKYTKTLDDASHILELRGHDCFTFIKNLDIYDFKSTTGAIRVQTSGESFTKIDTARSSVRLFVEFDFDNSEVAQTSIGTMIGGGNVTMSSINNNRVLREPRQFIASTIPAFGQWSRGDIVYKSTPNPGDNVGWICTVDGDVSEDPAIFSAFGKIEE